MERPYFAKQGPWHLPDPTCPEKSSTKKKKADCQHVLPWILFAMQNAPTWIAKIRPLLPRGHEDVEGLNSRRCLRVPHVSRFDSPLAVDLSDPLTILGAHIQTYTRAGRGSSSKTAMPDLCTPLPKKHQYSLSTPEKRQSLLGTGRVPATSRRLW